MDLRLTKLNNIDLKQFKTDMQEAFQLGAIESNYKFDENEDIILPESHIDQSLDTEGAIAYKVTDGENMVGGAIVVIGEAKKEGHLDFLYVKHGVQSKGIGKFIWSEIEKMYPEIEVWETCTPYFEKRNIHFYINVCGFYAVEFYHENRKDLNALEVSNDMDDDGMFVFRKWKKI